VSKVAATRGLGFFIEEWIGAEDDIVEFNESVDSQKDHVFRVH
jgi:hypothetical protein